MINLFFIFYFYDHYLPILEWNATRQGFSNITTIGHFFSKIWDMLISYVLVKIVKRIWIYSALILYVQVLDRLFDRNVHWLS